MVPQMAIEHLGERSNQTMSNEALSLGARQKDVTISLLYPPTPVVSLNPQPDLLCDRPVTPVAQLMLEPVTPMAPVKKLRKRLLNHGQPDDSEIGHPASPPQEPKMTESLSELTCAIASATSATTPATTGTSATTATTFIANAMALASPAHRPQSTLKRQGLVVYCSSFKQDVQKSQALVDMVESDTLLMGKLKGLIKRGRRFGGSPSRSFNQGRTRIRYVYRSAKDVDHQPVAKNPHKKRGQGRI